LSGKGSPFFHQQSGHNCVDAIPKLRELSESEDYMLAGEAIIKDINGENFVTVNSSASTNNKKSIVNFQQK